MDFITTYNSNIILAGIIPLLTLIIGWVMDLCFGDPMCIPHPIVYMGKWIAFGEHRLNKGAYRKAKGACFVLFSIVTLFCISYTILELPHYLFVPTSMEWGIANIVVCIISTVLLWLCLAGKTLRKEVRDVFLALDESLEKGRKQVGRIVGRDTQNLSAQEVRTAALETLAENLSDGVVAPLFWFCLLGIPGMLTYKLINTFDSMIGYKNERYKAFGCWAAHIDDIANYIPARITALLILFAGSMYSNSQGISRLFANIRFTLHYGNHHASPNSGWPEAALASILDCRFGGTHDYFGEKVYKPHIGTNPRLLDTHDMHQSIRICLIAEIITILLILTLKLLT